MITNFNANVFQIFQLLVVSENSFVAHHELFLVTNLPFKILFLFLFEHSSQDGIARSLVHFEHAVGDNGFYGALRQVVYQSPVVIVTILIFNGLFRIFLNRSPFLLVC